MSKITALSIGMANPNCIQDATHFDSFLRDRDVKDKRLLIGERASKPAVTQVLKQVEKLTKEDTFILYFAGHTDQHDEIKKGSEKDGKDEVLQLYGSVMTDDELTASIQKLKCQVLFVADTCFAASVVDNIKTIKSPEIHCFAAAQEDETAWDNRFTVELLKALKVETQVDHWDMNQHSFKGSPLFFLRRAFKDIESMWNDQYPIYLTNTETEKEIPMPKEATQPVIVDRKGKELTNHTVMPWDADGDGVPDFVGARLFLSWSAEPHFEVDAKGHFSPVRSGEALECRITVAQCGGKEKTVRLKTVKAADIRFAILSGLKHLGIKFIGQKKHMELDYDKISLKPSKVDEHGKWVITEPCFSIDIPQPTIEETEYYLMAFLRSLNQLPYYKDKPFNPRLITPALDGARSGGE